MLKEVIAGSNFSNGDQDRRASKQWKRLNLKYGKVI